MLFYLKQKTFFVKSNKMSDAGLYIVATPIGNLSDLSPRAKEVLTNADVIAAEDTRVAKKLFTLWGFRCARLLLHTKTIQNKNGFKKLLTLSMTERWLRLSAMPVHRLYPTRGLSWYANAGGKTLK